MKKRLTYIFILQTVIYCYPLFAQEVKYEYAQENSDVVRTLHDAKNSAEELQKQTFEIVDTLSGRTIGLINHTSDSLNHLSDLIETKTRSRIDSLQQKLEVLKRNSDAPQEEIEEKKEKINAGIDNLKQKQSEKFQPDKLNDYANSIQNEHLINPLYTHNLPVLEKLTIPGISSLPSKGNSSNTISLPNNNTNKLTSGVDEQLGKINKIRDNEWIKTDFTENRQLSNEAGEYSQMIKDPSKMDQAIDAQVGQLTEFRTLSAETKELTALQELPASMLADLKRYEDVEAMKAEAKEGVVKQATDYFADHQDKLTEAQSMMTKLKKKYSYVPDSQDLSTAIKTTSLQHEPLKRRLVFGLGFQLHRTNPISLDLSPNIMYRFNTLFSAGISGTYRASLGIENKKSISPNTSTDVYGVSALAQHRVWKGFFAHGEMQYLSIAITDPNTGTDMSTRRWNEGLMFGIGKQMSFSNALNGQIIFTYDFLHDQFSPNPKAWNIKFGFQVGQFKLKDIRF